MYTCSGSEAGSNLMLVSLNSRLESKEEEEEDTRKEAAVQPLSSEYGTYKTYRTRSWSWLSGTPAKKLKLQRHKHH